jgi:adenine deaminase
VISIDGGLAITSKLSNDKIEVSSLGLPYAGLMSIEAPYEVGRKFKILKEKSKELTSGISEPFMALSFMALPVIPKLKLTDKGLVDVDKFEIIPLFDLNN